MDTDAGGSWMDREGRDDELDFVLLENHVRETSQQLNLKRRCLAEMRDQLEATDLARHEMERQLERSRQQSEETQLQLDLAATAARRWEDVGVGGREAASRQRTQLELALGERDNFWDQARQLQTEVARLQSKAEADEGQLRVKASYNETLTRGLAKVRSLQDYANRQLQKLEGDHSRLEEMVAEALRRGAELELLTDHSTSAGERADKQRAALEDKLARLAAELERMKVLPSSQTQMKLDATSGDEEMTLLREVARETKASCVSLEESSEAMTVALEQAQGQQTYFQSLLVTTQEELRTEKARASELESSYAALSAEAVQLRENLGLTQQLLQTARKNSVKAECVERGTQCTLAPEQELAQPPPTA